MTAAAHRIQQLSLEVEVQGVPEAAAAQWPDKLRAWVEAELLPELDVALDGLLPQKEAVVRLESLSLDLGTFSGRDFEKISAEQLRASLSRAISNLGVAEKSAEHPAKDRLDSLAYFLETGRLPWWADQGLPFTHYEQQWQQCLDNQRIDLADWRLLLGKLVARQRLASLFSPKFKLAVLDRFLFAEGKKNASDKALRHHLSSTQDSLSAAVWAAIFQLISLGETAQAQQILEGRPLAQNLNLEHAETPVLINDTAVETTPIYLKNAGVVLLHPFLEMFFEATGVAKDGQLMAPEKAVQLLHQLAVGRVGAEYELPLNKLLCGLHPDAFLEANVRLSEAEKQECETLLRAVIRHWSALGDSSVEGLQGSFLCRDGKLTKRQDGAWLLQVEQLGYDMLLDQLPWNISMVKLPWMADLLWVEWR